MPPDVLYDDGTLRIDADGLTIRHYYFPLARARRIPFSAVRGVEVEPLRWRNGRGRGWGTTDLRRWMPLENGRFRKESLVVIDVGSRVRPALTPDDPERVAELIRAGARDAGPS